MISRCSACPGVNACLPPDGPMTRGGILFIGEAPGKDEDRLAKKAMEKGWGWGKPFIGKTGQEVDGHYLPVAGLKRSDVTFVNAIQCLPTSSGGKLDSGSPKDQGLLDTCATHHLYPLIERLQPRVVVPLGSFACRAVCPGLDLELQHGIPVESPWGIPAFPMYHPALGIHEPKKMLYIRTDWHRLRQFLAGKLYTPVDAFQGREDYAEITTAGELAGLLDRQRPLAMDTETQRGGQPHCLTFSQWPGAGRLIRAERTDLLSLLQSELDAWMAPILFHNWLYDAAIVDKMGLRLPLARIVDTMARVFNLGNLPQGLKALSFRELGMLMQDFDDLVRPYSRERVLNFYRLAAMMEWPKPEEVLVDNGAGGMKLYRPQSMGTKLKRFFTDLKKNPEGKDVFSIWENWDTEMIEKECGKFPGICISHVPFEKILRYACRDVDALVRLWPVLRRMRTRVRRAPQEGWRAA